MVFNSISYFCFFLIVFCVIFRVKQQFRTLFLIFASFVFIGSSGLECLLIFVVSASITYYIGKKIANTLELTKRKFFLRLGIFSNLILLFFFKYMDAGTEDFSFFSIHFNPDKLLIALGISFYTLQNIAFLMEVYANRLKFEYSFLDFTLYASFFPKFIMGPIILPQDFLPQIKNTEFLQSNIILGSQRIVLGLVKKMVVADRLSAYIHYNFDQHPPAVGLTALMVSYLFTLQLYFDFSGYTDIAIGTTKMLGFDLKENFNFPLRSKSIAEFWRNWHISLTSWFTTYVFYPLSYRYRKIKRIGIALAILVTFLVSGIWHGLGITFVIYTTSHALYMCFGIFTQAFRGELHRKFPKQLIRFAGILLTFNLVSLSFVFFRANNLNDALHLIITIFDARHFLPKDWFFEFSSQLAIKGDQESLFNFYVSVLLCGIFILFERKIQQASIQKELNYKTLFVLILILLFFGIFSDQAHFIYNQF